MQILSSVNWYCFLPSSLIPYPLDFTLFTSAFILYTLTLPPLIKCQNSIIKCSLVMRGHATNNAKAYGALPGVRGGEVAIGRPAKGGKVGTTAAA